MQSQIDYILRFSRLLEKLRLEKPNIIFVASLIFIDHTGAKFKFLYKCGKCFVVCLVQLLFQLSQQVFSRIRLMFSFSNFYFCMYHACIGILIE